MNYSFVPMDQNSKYCDICNKYHKSHCCKKYLKGEKGDIGAKGEIGDKGDMGNIGTMGSKGEPGSKGDIGTMGSKGDIGTMGSKGEDGSKGDLGPKGDKGEIGDIGTMGSKGDKGEIGDIGTMGSKGDKGEIGDKGDMGDKGEIGMDGAAGPKGETGDTNAWLLDGNTIGDNFLGTINDKDLMIKTKGELVAKFTTFGKLVLLHQQPSNNMNIAIGDDNTFEDNTTGTNNNAFGSNSLQNNTTGSFNSAFGTNSLQNNIEGSFNSAFGHATLTHNTKGEFNTAIGNNALVLNTTGIGGTAIGYDALKSNTTGNYNIAIGRNALMFNLTGSFNTIIGSNSDVTSNSFDNATAIGANVQLDASNKIRLGDTNVGIIEGAVSYTVPSDGRFKKDVTNLDHGLEFINKLRPVTYHWDSSAYAKHTNIPDSNRNLEAEQQKDSKLMTGFIAQEVEQSANDIKYNFSGINAPENDIQTYSLAYAQFVVPLVKAVQELHVKNQELETRLAALES